MRYHPLEFLRLRNLQQVFGRESVCHGWHIQESMRLALAIKGSILHVEYKSSLEKKMRSKSTTKYSKVDYFGNRQYSTCSSNAKTFRTVSCRELEQLRADDRMEISRDLHSTHSILRSYAESGARCLQEEIATRSTARLIIMHKYCCSSITPLPSFILF